MTASAPVADGGVELMAGETAYADAHFEQALQRFEAAYARNKEPRTLYRIGDAADKLGDRARVLSAFEQYLKLEPTSRERAFIESRIRANRAALGLSAPATVKVARTASTPGKGAERAREEHTSSTRIATSNRPASAPAAGPQQTQHVQPSAASAPNAALTASAQRDDPSAGRAGPWWIWAGAGALVATGIVMAAVLLESGETTPDRIRGNLGQAVQTLTLP